MHYILIDNANNIVNEKFYSSLDEIRNDVDTEDIEVEDGDLIMQIEVIKRYRIESNKIAFIPVGIR